MTSSDLVNCNFVSRTETITFSPYLTPPKFGDLVNILYGTIVICLSSVRVCSSFNRTQVETLVIWGLDCNVTFERCAQTQIWPDSFKEQKLTCWKDLDMSLRHLQNWRVGLPTCTPAAWFPRPSKVPPAYPVWPFAIQSLRLTLHSQRQTSTL